MRSWAPQVRRSVTAGWSILWTRRRASARRRVGPTDDFPLPGLVDETVTDQKLHREDPACGGLRRAAVLPSPLHPLEYLAALCLVLL